MREASTKGISDLGGVESSNDKLSWMIIGGGILQRDCCTYNKFSCRKQNNLIYNVPYMAESNILVTAEV